MKNLAGGAIEYLKALSRRHWIGTAIIVAATLVFFAPLLPRLNHYSEGGDAMFNAWILARNHHCILRQGCPDYTDSNIYFPNSDTMLYSETQLSTGLLTLPLRLFSDNPVFYYNVWLIVGTFLNGFFMYLLAKHISKGNEPYSILAALVWQFAPHTVLRLGHMQILSELYIPLVFLLIIKYMDTKRRLYLAGLFCTLALLFYASWYMMVFAFAGMTAFLIGAWLTKIQKPRQLVPIVVTILLAVVATLPLLTAYMRFSKDYDANFTIGGQVHYASSVADYFIPYPNTIFGEVYDEVAPSTARRLPYSADGPSFMGISLLAIAGVILWGLIFKRKSKLFKGQRSWLIVWALVGGVGLIMSLGPLLKIGGGYTYGQIDDGTRIAVPLPYILLDFTFPAIKFIRAVERWGVLLLLSLSAMIAILPHVISKHVRLRKQSKLVFGVLVSVIVFELMPTKPFGLLSNPRANAMTPPAAYTYIRDNDVNNILILQEEGQHNDFVRPKFEQVLWAGYHNKNIFNGYSGYEPDHYKAQLEDYMDFYADDIAKIRNLGIENVLVSKYTASDRAINMRVEGVVGPPIYDDREFALYSITE